MMNEIAIKKVDIILSNKEHKEFLHWTRKFPRKLKKTTTGNGYRGSRGISGELDQLRADLKRLKKAANIINLEK